MIYAYIAEDTLSPVCRERRCRWVAWDAVGHPVRLFRHGENPEAVLVVDRFRADDLYQQLRDFAERCHRYEDGEAT